MVSVTGLMNGGAGTSISNQTAVKGVLYFHSLQIEIYKIQSGVHAEI